MSAERPAANVEPLACAMRRAARRGGWLDIEDMRAAGVTRARYERLVELGILAHEAQGLYRVASAVPTWEDYARALLKRWPGALSHESAAAAWGLEGIAERPVHITVERAKRVKPLRGVVVHTTRDPLRPETAMFRGMRLTLPMRTLVDLARSNADDGLLRRFLDHCVARRWLSPEQVDAGVPRNSRRRGDQRLRSLLSCSAGGRIDSVVEAELLRTLRAAGLPRPVTQFTITSNGRFLGRVDLAWPAQKVALELDGYLHHSDAATFVADRERGNRIVAAGWQLMRTTPASLRRDPAHLVADIKAVLDTAVGARRNEVSAARGLSPLPPA